MTIYVLGTNHNDMRSARLVSKTIEEVQPMLVFVEYGDFRYKMTTMGMSTPSRIMEMFKFKWRLSVKSRVLSRITKIRSRFVSSSDPLMVNKSTDMNVAISIARENGIDVIPMDMELSKILNEVSSEVISISQLGNIREDMPEIDANELENLDDVRELRRELQESTSKELNEFNLERERHMVRKIMEKRLPSTNSVVVTGAYHLPSIVDMLNSEGYDVSHSIY